jgi:hypothetical protein
VLVGKLRKCTQSLKVILVKVATLDRNPNEDGRSRIGTLVKVAILYENSDEGNQSRRGTPIEVILAEKRHFRREKSLIQGSS